MFPLGRLPSQQDTLLPNGGSADHFTLDASRRPDCLGRPGLAEFWAPLSGEFVVYLHKTTRGAEKFSTEILSRVIKLVREDSVSATIGNRLAG